MFCVLTNGNCAAVSPLGLWDVEVGLATLWQSARVGTAHGNLFGDFAEALTVFSNVACIAIIRLEDDLEAIRNKVT